MIGKVLGVGTGVAGGVAALAARPIAVAVGLIGVLVVVALCWTIKNVERTKNLVSVIHALHGPGSAADRPPVDATATDDSSLSDAPVVGADVDFGAQVTGLAGEASAESAAPSPDGRRAECDGPRQG